MHQRDTLKLKAIRSNDPNVWLNFLGKAQYCKQRDQKSILLNEFRENTGNSKKTWFTNSRKIGKRLQ